MAAATTRHAPARPHCLDPNLAVPWMDPKPGGRLRRRPQLTVAPTGHQANELLCERPFSEPVRTASSSCPEAPLLRENRSNCGQGCLHCGIRPTPTSSRRLPTHGWTGSRADDGVRCHGWQPHTQTRKPTDYHVNADFLSSVRTAASPCPAASLPRENRSNCGEGCHHRGIRPTPTSSRRLLTHR